jgi:hypothetical protein
VSACWCGFDSLVDGACHGEFFCDTRVAVAGLHSEARQCFESARELARSIQNSGVSADAKAPSAADTKMEVSGRAGLVAGSCIYYVSPTAE